MSFRNECLYIVYSFRFHHIHTCICKCIFQYIYPISLGCGKSCCCSVTSTVKRYLFSFRFSALPLDIRWHLWCVCVYETRLKIFDFDCSPIKTHFLFFFVGLRICTFTYSHTEIRWLNWMLSNNRFILYTF